MRFYISGKITGLDRKDYMKNFFDAQARLIEQGHQTINPAIFNDVLPAETTYEEFMKIDLFLLSMCDAIYLLDGWEDSKGAKAEFQKAKELGLEIHYETPQWKTILMRSFLMSN